MRKRTTDFVVMAAICVVLCWVEVEGAELRTFSLEYSPFNKKSAEILEVLGSAIVNNHGLQLTPEVTSSRSDNPMAFAFNSGRVLVKQRFKLWEEEGHNTNINGSVVASFNTSFLFNIYNDKLGGEGPQGLAFVVASDLHLPIKSFGPYLGLTDPDTDGRERNELVAVEFDAFKDDSFEDPDGNHVGIDVNSVRSIKTQSLTPHNITLNAAGIHLYNVWVDYDGVNRVIDVFIAEQADQVGETPPKPHSPILSSPLNLRDHLNDYSYIGFSASTGSENVLNTVLKWNLTVHHFSDHETRIKSESRIVMSVLGLVLVGAAAGIGFWFYKHKTESLSSKLVRALKCLPGMPREFKFSDLKKATHNFDKKNKLGQGGFGVVYRGLLAKEKVEIAVKWFSRETIKSQHDFISELTVINRLRHKHLVKLLGWCNKKGKLLLVYEYMPNSSLDRHLFLVAPNKQPLPWNLRHKIITGVASALHYLHNEYDHKVIHRDLKASNIMLDNDFNARLVDFGLAKVLDNEKTSYAEAEGVLGTKGYIAPECLLTGKATRQSDVYAFGAVILETVCGQRPGARLGGFNYLVDWVWMLHRENRLVEAVDERLGDEYVEEEAKVLLLLGLACSHLNSSERPKTKDILQIISGTMLAPAVPPLKPPFLWAAAVAVVQHTVDEDGDSVNSMSITVSDLVR